MIYTLPQNVISPQDAISNVNVLYDGGDNSVSIAEITWFWKIVIGIRWNVSMREWDDSYKIGGGMCLGNPISRGYPTWFILPPDLFNSHSDLSQILKSIEPNN